MLQNPKANEAINEFEYLCEIDELIAFMNSSFNPRNTRKSLDMYWLGSEFTFNIYSFKTSKIALDETN